MMTASDGLFMESLKRHSMFPALLALVLTMTGGNSTEEANNPRSLRGFQELGHAQVKLNGGFWGPRLETARKVTMPHSLDELEEGGHVANFDKAAGKFSGLLKGHHAFDSDLSKVLEVALIAMQHCDDCALRKRVEEIVDRVLAARQKVGVLICYFIVNGLDTSWDDFVLDHRMYNAGHFFEMACEHHKLTGRPKVINAAERFKDCTDGIFEDNMYCDVDGHEEVELALIKTFRNTGERRYLDLAKLFLDERGCAHGNERKRFDPKSRIPPEKQIPRLALH